MSKLLIRDARVLALAQGPLPRRGEQLGQLSTLEHHDVWIADGQIERVEPTAEQPTLPSDCETRLIEADGRVLMPGFVDCHTHACWAGDRLDEWQRKLAGASYLQLLESGGGIMSTVRAVRSASENALAEGLLQRLERILRAGTTTIEVKSGYGLSTFDELKMLRAIAAAGERFSGQVIPTACLGHALDPALDHELFVQQTIQETLPAVTAEFPNIPVDAYCEEGAWSLNECRQLFDAAQTAGHPVRVHADQFNSLGMIDLAIENHYLSVDHLEATDSAALSRLAESSCFGVMLPACGFHLDGRYGDGRTFVDAGGALAIASNYNPGSAPCYAMPMVIALAVRSLGLSVNEAITASTSNPAALLGLGNVGRIEPGLRADLLLLNETNEAQLAFEFGVAPIQEVIVGGKLI